MAFSPSFTTQSVFYFVLFWLYMLAVVFYLGYVHSRLVFTEGTNLAVSNIPFYIRQGYVQNQADTEFLSLNWFVYASDYALVATVPLYAFTAWGISTLRQFRYIALGYSGIMYLLFAVQLLKALYWNYYFWLSCGTYPFCINRSLGEDASTPDPTFLVTVVMSWVFLVLNFALFGLASTVREGRLASPAINKKFSDIGYSVSSLEQRIPRMPIPVR